YGGSIHVRGITAGKDVILEIRPDPVPGFREWWYFSVRGEPGEVRRLIIANTAETLVPVGWSRYQASCPHDIATWVRVPTTYADERLIIEHAAAAAPVWYAYFPPYLEIHRDNLLAFCRADARARVTELARVGPDDVLDLVEI